MTIVESAPTATPMLDPSELYGTVVTRVYVANDDLPPAPPIPKKPSPVVGIDYSPFVLSERQYQAYQQLMAPVAALANVWFDWLYNVGNACAPLYGLRPIPRHRLAAKTPDGYLH